MWECSVLCECLVYDSITELSLIFNSHIPVPIEISVQWLEAP